jgi:hypothetical protein
VLARCKNCYHADRRSCLAVRKSGDDVKPITLDGVVSHPRHLAEVDALALYRAQASARAAAREAIPNTATKSMLRIDIAILLLVDYRARHIIDHQKTSPP